MPTQVPGGFVGQKSILRQLVLAANIQAAWGAPVAQNALTEALRYDVSGFVKFQQDKESTYGQAGALNSFANENWITSHKAALDFSGYLTDWIAGWLFGMGMGKELVAGAGPYSHTYNFLDTGTVANATTLYARDTNDVAYQLVDMGLSQLTITSTGTGALKFKATMMGTGRTVDGVLQNMPTPVSRQKLYGSDTQVEIGPAGGALASFYPRCLSWELTIDCGLQEQRPSGSGLYASHLIVNMPKVKLKMVISANAVDDIYAWKRNNTLLQTTLTTSSGPSALVVTVPNFTLDAGCSLGDSNGQAAWTIDLGETDILQVGNTPLVTIGVTNTQASFLTAA